MHSLPCSKFRGWGGGGLRCLGMRSFGAVHGPQSRPGRLLRGMWLVATCGSSLDWGGGFFDCKKRQLPSSLAMVKRV